METKHPTEHRKWKGEGEASGRNQAKCGQYNKKHGTVSDIL
jgi:hypothetical protein